MLRHVGSENRARLCESNRVVLRGEKEERGEGSLVTRRKTLFLNGQNI